MWDKYFFLYIIFSFIYVAKIKCHQYLTRVFTLKTACFKFLQLIFMGMKTFWSLVAVDSSLPCRESYEPMRVRNTLTRIRLLQSSAITQQPLTWPTGRIKISAFGKHWRAHTHHFHQVEATSPKRR